jgi:hypothetical protein
MLLGWINRADDALLSTDSELTTLPASNVQQVHVAKQWRTAAGVKSAYLLFDMQSSVACQLLGVMGGNITAAATIRLRASDADPTATGTLLLDTGSLAATAKEGYGSSYHDFAATTARYWRLDIADAAVEDNLRIGRVFLGPRWEPSSNQEYGWSVQSRDPSDVDRAYAGQKFANTKPQMRVLQFSLNFMDEAEMFDNAFAMGRAVGITGDILAVQDSLGGARIAEQSVWGSLTDVQPLVHENHGIFREKFTIEETL